MHHTELITVKQIRVRLQRFQVMLEHDERDPWATGQRTIRCTEATQRATTAANAMEDQCDLSPRT